MIYKILPQKSVLSLNLIFTGVVIEYSYSVATCTKVLLFKLVAFLDNSFLNTVSRFNFTVLKFHYF